jgi:hypothetical protein
MRVYGSDLQLTVKKKKKKQNKDNVATRAVVCEVLFDYA